MSLVTGECGNCTYGLYLSKENPKKCIYCGAPEKALKCEGKGCPNKNVCPDCGPDYYWPNGRLIRSGDSSIWG